MTLFLVLITIVTFLLVDLFYQKIKTKKTIFDSNYGKLKNLHPFNYQNLFIPQNYFYNQGHTSFKIAESGNLFIGIDDFAKNFIGEVKTITPIDNNRIQRGNPLFTIKTDYGEFEFKSPVTGKIIKFNESILSELDSLKNSSVKENWICTIQPEKLATEIKSAKIAEEAKEWFKNEIIRLKDFLSINNNLTPVPVTMYDGGELMYGISENLDREKLQKFQQEFLEI